MEGKITVKVQNHERLETIRKLADVSYELAKALNAPTYVNIQNCHIESSGCGIYVDKEETYSESSIELDEPKSEPEEE